MFREAARGNGDSRTQGGLIMTETAVIDRNAWQTFFDGLTEDQEGMLITIEVVGRTVGDQFEVERKPFLASTYDPRDDVVVVTVGLNGDRPPTVLRHMITNPTEVDLTVPAPGLTSVRVLPADGPASLLHFVPKPALPESD
jgi:Family of unknown function (DUF5335)